MVYLLSYTTKILFTSLNSPMLNVPGVSHFLDFVIVIIFGAGYKLLKLFPLYFKLTCCVNEYVAGKFVSAHRYIPPSQFVCCVNLAVRPAVQKTRPDGPLTLYRTTSEEDDLGRAISGCE
jgi:hypothetical protein